MKKTENELREKLEKILQLYILAQYAYLFTEDFHNPNTKY